MDPTQIMPAVHTPFADLDLLLGEAEFDAVVAPEPAGGDEPEPDTIDAFNAQILAGLVSP